MKNYNILNVCSSKFVFRVVEVLVATRSRHGSDKRTGLSFTTVSPLRYVEPYRHKFNVYPLWWHHNLYNAVGTGVLDCPFRCRYRRCLLTDSRGRLSLQFANWNWDYLTAYGNFSSIDTQKILCNRRGRRHDDPHYTSVQWSTHSISIPLSFMVGIGRRDASYFRSIRENIRSLTLSFTKNTKFPSIIYIYFTFCVYKIINLWYTIIIG